MKRVCAAVACCLLVAVTIAPARADFWSDGYSKFFGSRPTLGHARWIELQKQGWIYVNRHARAGNAEAMYALARVYYFSGNQIMTGYHDDARVAYPDGRLILTAGEATNHAEGCGWFLRSVAAGYKPAMLYAGLCHEKGYGIPTDRAKAADLYRRTAESGDYNGARLLADLHVGQGAYAEARQWYQKAADRGDKTSLVKLARLWEEGKGGPQDIARARSVYERTDYPRSAKYYLGTMYEDGRGVPKDEAKALALYKLAEDDYEVGRLARSRIAAIGNRAAREKKRAEDARRLAADETERKRVAALTAGLETVSEFRKVAVANATIRALPERGAAAGRTLKLGEQVHVVGRLRSGWVRVAEEGVPVGWLHGGALEQTIAGTAPRTAVTDTLAPRLIPLDAPFTVRREANVRAAPSVQAPRVAGLAVGDKVTALGRVDGGNWYLVARGGARIGYVFGDLLTPDQPPAAGPAGTADRVEFGRYHALVVGNNDYRNVARLATAVADARAVAALLRETYGYQVTLLENATRAQVLRALTGYRRTLTEADNLLIYYAGHGWLDTDADRGYWLPVDAEQGDPTNWISNATITDSLRALHARHVMVVADSCYSGSLTRGVKLAIRTPDYIARLAGKAARTVLTSGGLEPVTDRGRGGHSVFANAFLDALRENDGVLDGHTLFSRLRRTVMLNANQTPDYGDIRQAGHEGGDFLFVKRR